MRRPGTNTWKALRSDTARTAFSPWEPSWGAIRSGRRWRRVDAGGTESRSFHRMRTPVDTAWRSTDHNVGGSSPSGRALKALVAWPERGSSTFVREPFARSEYVDSGRPPWLSRSDTCRYRALGRMCVRVWEALIGVVGRDGRRLESAAWRSFSSPVCGYPDRSGPTFVAGW